MSPWWQEAVFYHLYVRSFQDSDGDGIGDLPGLLSRLPILAELGVDALWLSPIYPSPQADFGYDVADHRGVDPVYGGMADLARLRDELHRRGMRLILDFVPNHTSDQHPWFRESCADRSSAKRDWYLWRNPGPGGGPPNNWCGIFGGSAWSYAATSEQFYLHSFLPQQPDLNWRNPEVVAAMHDHLRFWLDWGADGFRIDAIPHVIKDAELRSNPPHEAYAVPPDDPAHDPFCAQQHLHDRMQPELFDVIRGLRGVLDEYPDRVLVGETATDELAEYARFFGPGLFDLGFYFGMLGASSLTELRRAVDAMYAALPVGCWPTLVLSNHDVDRHLTRLAGGANDPVAKAAAAALLLCWGTPFVYYGDEIGLPNTAVPAEKLRDPAGIFERDARRRLFFSKGYESFGRDPERTPMPWDRHGGFTTGEPWLPMGDPQARNVADQRGAADSVWRWHQALLELRRERRALRLGDHQPLAADAAVWAFARGAPGERLLVGINLTDQPAALPAAFAGKRALLGSRRPSGEPMVELELAAHEVVVVED